MSRVTVIVGVLTLNVFAGKKLRSSSLFKITNPTRMKVFRGWKCIKNQDGGDIQIFSASPSVETRYFEKGTV